MTAAQLKTLLVDGAVIGGSTAGGILILNAYESLRLAAQRPGRRSAGNRMWRRGLNVVVRRTDDDRHLPLDTWHGHRPAQASRRQYLGARNAKGWLFLVGNGVFTQAPDLHGQRGRELLRLLHDADSSGDEHGNGATTEAVRYTQPTPLAVFQGYPKLADGPDLQLPGVRRGGTGSGINCSWRCTRRSWTRRPT
ncbi:MAG: hypothetical protein IPI38_14215 [Gemmatimonadetes bacterium]|nr:hypothetical protein [Gemmatimonadota bacterium]